jgi:hypothetical protein
MRTTRRILAVCVAALFLAVTARIQAADPPEKPALKLKPQATCPIMGGKILKKYFVDAGGYRFYMCCPGCTKAIQADPQKALAKLKSLGQTAEVRLALCPKCGEIKGTAKCCAKDVKKCSKCGLNEGSVGCCKDFKPPEKGEDILICPKCGEQMGAKHKCDLKAEKCPKCGLDKGAPACCKLDFLKPKKAVDAGEESEHSSEHGEQK